MKKNAMSHVWLCLGIGFWFLPGLAKADLTINEQVTVTKVKRAGNTMSPSNQQSGDVPSMPQNLKLYFKDSNARTEIEGGAVTLYNGADEKVYVLDPASKTYFVLSLNDFEGPPQNPASHKSVAVTTANGITFMQCDQTQTVAGFQAKALIVSGTVTIRPERPREGGPEGGFGGGDNPGGNPSFSKNGAGTVEVSGEYWISDAVKIPNDRKATLFPAIFVAAQPERFVFKPLSDSLSKKKEIPLSSRISVTRTLADGTQESVTTSTLAKDISDQPLPDLLFQLPIGYTQIAPPPPPATGPSQAQEPRQME